MKAKKVVGLAKSTNSFKDSALAELRARKNESKDIEVKTITITEKSNEVEMNSSNEKSNSSLTNSLTKNLEKTMDNTTSKSQPELVGIVSNQKEAQMEGINSIFSSEIEQGTASTHTLTTKQDSEPTYRRADARKTASIRNVRLLKRVKRNNLVNQLREIRSTLKRGYYIIKKELIAGDPSSVNTTHQNLDEAEREFLRKKREHLRYELLILGNEIAEYTSDLKSLSYRTKMAISNKYSKTLNDVKIKKSVRRIVDLIDKQLLKDAQNGQRDFLKGLKEDQNEINQKELLSTYIGKILTPNHQKVLMLPQAQEVIIRRSLNSVKQLEM